ncbi:hypothetical protein [Streptomyces sp. NPDC005799]
MYELSPCRLRHEPLPSSAGNPTDDFAAIIGNLEVYGDKLSLHDMK